MATAANQKSMELEGNLGSFQLPDVLRFLAMGRLSGTLFLENDRRQVVLLIGEGRLRGCASPDPDLKLGQLLVHGGHLSRRQLQELTDGQPDPPTARLARMLLQRKLVDADVLCQTLALQAKEELWDAFSWTTGTFHFEHGQPSADEAQLDLEIEPLISEGAQRLEQWRAMERNLGQLDEVYGPCAKVAGRPEQPLSAKAWRVLALVNSRRSVRALVHLSGLGKFETLHALDHLLALGLIESVGRKPRAAAGTSATAPAPARPAAESEPEESGGAARRGGLFGILRKSGSGEESAPAAPQAAEHYLTSVGFGCALLTQLARELARRATIQPLDRLWDEALTLHPRADMVHADANGLDARRYERYAEMAEGTGGALACVHDETMEALLMLGRGLFEQAPREAAEVFRSSVLPMAEAAHVRWPGDFQPRAWAMQIMETAQAGQAAR